MKPSEVFEKAMEQAIILERQAEELAAAMKPMFEPEHKSSTDSIYEKDLKARGITGLMDVTGGNGK